MLSNRGFSITFIVGTYFCLDTYIIIRVLVVFNCPDFVIARNILDKYNGLGELGKHTRRPYL